MSFSPIIARLLVALLFCWGGTSLAQSPAYRQSLPSTNQSVLKAAALAAVDANNHVYVLDPVSKSVVEYDEVGNELRAIKQFSAKGKLYELQKPTCLTVDSKNRLWVYDQSHQLIFQMDGDKVSTFGKAGSKRGQLDEVQDMAVDADGYLYLLQAKRNCVEIFHPEGYYITALTTSKIGFQEAFAIDVSMSNDLYVLDQTLSSVFIYNVEGAMINAHRSLHKRQGVILEKATDLTVTADGGFVVLDGATGDALVFDKDGLIRTNIRVVDGTGDQKVAAHVATSLHRSPHMAVTYASNKGVKIFETSLHSAAAHPQLQRMHMLATEASAWTIQAMAANSQGYRVILTGEDDEAVVVLDATGAEVLALKKEFKDAADVAISAVNHVYVVDQDAAIIQVLDVKGTLIRTLGKEKSVKLKEPVSLTINRTGQIIVADAKSADLHVWSSDGVYQKVFLQADRSHFKLPHQIESDQKDQVYVWDKEDNCIYRIAAGGWPVALKKLQVPGLNGDAEIGKIGGFFIDPMDQIHVFNATTKQIEIYRWDLEPVRCFSMGSDEEGPYGWKGIEHLSFDAYKRTIYAQGDNGKLAQAYLFAVSPPKPMMDLRWDLDEKEQVFVFFDAPKNPMITGYALQTWDGENWRTAVQTDTDHMPVSLRYEDTNQAHELHLIALNYQTPSERGTWVRDFLGWAKALEAERRWEKAISAYTLAMEMNITERLKRSLITHFCNLSAAFIEENEHNKAMAILRLAHAHAPKDERVHALYSQGLAQSFLHTLDYQSVAYVMPEMERLHAQNGMKMIVEVAVDDLTDQLMRRGSAADIEQAILIQNKWAQLQKNQVNELLMARLELAKYHLMKAEVRAPGELESLLLSAEQHAITASNGTNDEAFQALLVVLNIQNIQGKFDLTEKRAAAEINQSAKRADANQMAELHMYLANAFAGQKKYELALAEYDRLLLMKPNNHDATVGKGQCLLALNRPDEALQLCEAALAQQPANMDLALLMGHVFVAKQDHHNAIFQLEKVVRNNPGDARAYAPLAQSHAALGNHKKAVEHWNVSYLDIKERLRMGKGGLLTQQEMRQYGESFQWTGEQLVASAKLIQDHDLITKICDDLLSEFPKAPQVHFERGTALLNRGLLYESAKAYYTACQLDPTNANFVSAHKGVTELIESSSQNKQSLSIMDITTQPIFPALYKNYTAKQQLPLGELVVSNNTQLPITPQSITVFIAEFMEQPTSISNPVLMGYSDTHIPIYALLEDRILTTTKTEVQIVVQIQFVDNGELRTTQQSSTVSVMGRNAINWDDKMALSAFVTTDEPCLRALHHLSDEALDDVPTNGIPDHIVKAAQIITVLETFQLHYSADPNSPFASASVNNAVLDYLKFPVEMLQEKAGDCDDFVVLLASLFETAGIATAYIDVPGHVFLALELAVPKNQLKAMGLADHEVIVKEDKTWIPLETTLLGQTDFIGMWKAGADRYHASLTKGEFPELIPMKRAFARYQPVLRYPTAFDCPTNLSPAMHKSYESEIFKLVAKLRKEVIMDLEDRYLKEPDNVFVKNKYALLLARSGEAQKAEIILNEALALTPDNAVVLNNLGNVQFLNGNYDNALLNYQSAAAQDGADSEILINLCRTYLALNRKAEARDFYEKALKLDSQVQQLYPHLKSKIQ